MQLLNKYTLYLFHIRTILSQFPKFYAVGNEKRNGDSGAGILAGIAAELPQKGALVAIHAAKAQITGRIGDFAVPVFQPQS